MKKNCKIYKNTPRSIVNMFVLLKKKFKRQLKTKKTNSIAFYCRLMD